MVRKPNITITRGKLLGAVTGAVVLPGQLSPRGSCPPGAVVAWGSCPVGQLSPGQMSPGQMSPGQLSAHHINN